MTHSTHWGWLGCLGTDGVADGACILPCIISPGWLDDQRSSADCNAGVGGQCDASFTPNHTDLWTRRPAATQRHIPTFQRQSRQRQTHSVHSIWRWKTSTGYGSLFMFSLFCLFLQFWLFFLGILSLHIAIMTFVLLEFWVSQNIDYFSEFCVYISQFWLFVSEFWVYQNSENTVFNSVFLFFCFRHRIKIKKKANCNFISQLRRKIWIMK